MTNLNIDNLLKAIENESNSTIVKLTSNKIKQHKNTILQQIQYKGSELKKMHKTLKNYRYCSEMCDINPGGFIRWINLTKTDNLFLTRGAHVVDVELIDHAIFIFCKSYNNSFFRFKFDEAIIFQKLNPQETVLLRVLDYLDKE